MADLLEVGGLEDTAAADAELAPGDLVSGLRDRFEHDARADLGDEGYDAAVRAGEAPSRDDAIGLALSVSARG